MSNFDTLFPTIIYKKDNPNLVSDDLKSLARKICFENGDYEFQSKCISTIRTYQKVLDLPEFQEIKTEIQNSIKEYCEYNKFDMSLDYQITSSWLNYYQPGMYQETHIHHSSFLSGVVYIIGSGMADFYVKSPIMDHQPILPRFECNSEFENYNYETHDGRILLFMSSTFHATRPTPNEKISLSFNVICN